jgi:pilus assembly protein CpaF
MPYDPEAAFGPARPALPDHVDRSEHQFQQLKVSIHQNLVESLDLSQLGHGDATQIWRHVRGLAERLCTAHKEWSGPVDQERLREELLAEITGLGPLEKLVRDPTISDILVNGPYTVYIERDGRLELTSVVFADEAHLMRIIQRIVARLGRRIDEVSPMVDARLPDGSRVNAVIPPLSLGGPTLSIRRFGLNLLTMEELLGNGSLTPEIAEFLAAAVKARISCMISGGTGAGKTTLLNVLSSFLPPAERIITIEDSAELRLKHAHWVRMETRPPNTEGMGEITQRDLVRNSLRMRPDRIIVGEVRGAEVWDMLQAMNTGHEGSLTTIHANSARDALARLEMMVALTGFELPVSVVRQYVAAGIRLIVQVARLAGGPRRLVQVSEIVSVDNGDYRVEDIYRYEQSGVDDEGTAIGEFVATGYQPQCLARIRAAGIRLHEEWFAARRIPDQRSPDHAQTAAKPNGRPDAAERAAPRS